MAKKDCEACGGTGVVGWEVWFSRAEHHPSCDGSCQGGQCPIEVPDVDWEFEQCSCELEEVEDDSSDV